MSLHSCTAPQSATEIHVKSTSINSSTYEPKVPANRQLCNIMAATQTLLSAQICLNALRAEDAAVSMRLI